MKTCKECGVDIDEHPVYCPMCGEKQRDVFYRTCVRDCIMSDVRISFPYPAVYCPYCGKKYEN